MQPIKPSRADPCGVDLLVAGGLAALAQYAGTTVVLAVLATSCALAA